MLCSWIIISHKIINDNTEASNFKCMFLPNVLSENIVCIFSMNKNFNCVILFLFINYKLKVKKKIPNWTNWIIKLYFYFEVKNEAKFSTWPRDGFLISESSTFEISTSQRLINSGCVNKSLQINALCLFCLYV